jgi:hypothetical protein
MEVGQVLAACSGARVGEVGLGRSTGESQQRNGELVQLGLAAARASSERDAVRIATLEARLKTAKDKH